jgi:hypothetical protein
MSDTVDRLVSALDAELRRVAQEKARLEAVIERVGNVLAAHGCDCECAPTCGTEHDDDCDRCLGCRVEAALRGGS